MRKINKNYALIIIAHPDDESFLLAGTSLKLAESGKSLSIICATRGEKGSSRLKKPVSTTVLAKIRENELYKSAKILKIKQVEFLNYKDGQLFEADFDALTKCLASKINSYQPQLILTFGREGVTGHLDHITIGKAALQAAKLAKFKPKEVWLVCKPKSVIDTFNQYWQKIRATHAHYHPKKLKGTYDHKLLKISIRKYRKNKLKALFCHKSQGLPAWMVHNFPKVRNTFLGYEYFEVVKLKNK